MLTDITCRNKNCQTKARDTPDIFRAEIAQPAKRAYKRGMRNARAVPDEQKAREGAVLRKHWERYKSANPGEGQEAMAAKVGISQGFFALCLSGKRAIPIEHLIELAIEMDFDPREVRPEIDHFMLRLTRSIEGKNLRLIEHRLSELPPARQEAALRYLEFLAQETDPPQSPAPAT